ncbi:DUF1552 domain-containing protein [Rhodopirellula sallentina]|uniref:Secreted protein containing DUF1552 n=1 Tax=Rhodopirellula sallentina SM41 TaxID=1263870 RepID=M5U4R0_9BACT|nr:DUF1552 domain-containing protein [Rhodopirellula sallentina]EMI56447.1 secreted protein containing DUF1552 [Rhodopirellula sallentina SM41]
MKLNLDSLDRRRFLRGAGVALALPVFGSAAKLDAGAVSQVAESAGLDADASRKVKRLGCFYFPDGVPMPLAEDPAYQDWSWFPHGNGSDFRYTKCMEVFEPLRDQITVLSGFSHPEVRQVHGHSNADQFLTAAATGSDGPYKNSISLDQVYANHVGDQTRFSSLVLSTDGGTGTPRGTHTMSFTRTGRAIPAEHRPKRVFDMLFVKQDADAARRLALSKSALDELLADANRLRRDLGGDDRERLDEYLDSVRQAEKRVEKAKLWVNTPLPKVEVNDLDLEVSPEDPQRYVQTMFELIYLAFRTDSTRVATYQIGRENAFGISDRLARAVGFNLAHALSHETKQPGGWERFSTYCGFLNREFCRFVTRLHETPEPAGQGTMLDNTLLLFGSASSAFHLSQNYPVILAGGKAMGFKHGQYVNYAGAGAVGGSWDGKPEPWMKEPEKEDEPLTKVFVTMLQQLGLETESFADRTGGLSELV